MKDLLDLFLNLLFSVAVGVVICVVGFVLFKFERNNNLIDQAILYLAAVIGGGYCWIGLNLRKK